MQWFENCSKFHSPFDSLAHTALLKALIPEAEKWTSDGGKLDLVIVSYLTLAFTKTMICVFSMVAIRDENERLKG